MSRPVATGLRGFAASRRSFQPGFPMTAPVALCPSCGHAMSGKFCRQCGATGAASAACARCGTALPSTGRFCPGCGVPIASSGQVNTGERVLWFVCGGLVVALVGGLVLGLGGRSPVANAEAGGGPASFAATAEEGNPPDISNLTPRERFDRLFNRVMRAAESGDQATVTNFAPMAMSAYGMLDSVDADARYHAALIDLHTGNVTGAAALGDSILATQPGHLFGYVVRGTIARFQKNDRVLRQTYADFLTHYEKEKAQKRPEYEDHPKALEDFLAAAQKSGQAKS